MGFLSKLGQKLTSALERLSNTSIVQTIKDTIVSRASESKPSGEEIRSGMLSELQSRSNSAYKAYLTPRGLVQEGETQYVLPRDAYSGARPGQESKYMTYFEGVGYNPFSNEEETQTFGIAHEDLLTEEEMDEAINGFAGPSGDIEYTDITPLGGTTTMGEIYIEA